MTPDFPVWSIRPNWREGVLERLEWLTDVLSSSIGVEQRRALRVSPRRYMEITVNPTNNERSFLDLVLHKMGSDKWLCPLWWDQAKLSADISTGEARVDFDNTYREFLTGGTALLYKDAFTWEVISIGGQDDGGLDLDVVLDSDWPKGTKIFPLRLARLSTDTSLDALTSTVGEAVLLFQVIEPNDYLETEPTDLLFEAVPVLTTPPNRSETITTDHVRLSSERDNSTGIPYRVDPAGRAFQIQGHSWIKRGRQEQAEFRAFLYWLRGRQRALWLPSFNQDFVTSRASLLASISLDIQKIGIAYAGGVIPGRDAFLVDGTPARITDLGAPQSSAEERLRIGAGLSAAVAAGKTGSFMSPARLNQDTVELLHHADSDGAMECSLTFQTFNDIRDASGTIYYPIPVATMNSIACGYPGFAGLSWQLPCLSGGGVCSCADPAPQTYSVGGTEGVTYNLTVRVRAVVETTNYIGGTLYGGSGRVKKDATSHTPGAHNVYALTVSDPPATYYLNHGDGGEYVTALDYDVDIPINGGATVTLTASSQGGTQIANTGNATVPDDDSAYPIIVSQPYNGQFMQIDGGVV